MMTSSQTQDPWNIGSFTYEQDIKGIPLCSKLILNANAGNLTGLDKLQLVDINVLKVDANYDKCVRFVIMASG
jgi:hypothetical protein